MSQHSESSEEAEEPTALEYARSNGLSRDYLVELLGIPELCQLQDNLQSDSSDSGLPQFNLGLEPKVEERLSVSKDAAFMLQSVIREEDAKYIDTLVSSMLDTRQRTWPSKLELPLLSSDHETDCKSFASRKGFDIKPQDVKLPLEMVDDEQNEGLIYPPRFWNMGNEILQKAKAEKLSVSKDTVIFISNCLKPEWSEDDDKASWDSQQTYKRNTAREPVTPPLSPALKPVEQQPYEPTSSDSAYQVPLASSPISPTKQELEALEKMIFEQDIPTPLRIHTKTSLDEEPSSDTLPNDLDVKLSDIFSAMASMENTPPSSEEKRVKRDDLKLEELMTPSKSDISFPKSVRFNDVIEEMLLDPYSRSPSNDSVQKLMDETLGDALRQANQRAEQEKLVAADVNARVDVPIMDFSKPDPPWKDFEGIPNQATLMSRQMSFIRDVIGQRLPKLLHAGHKDINLKWSPFPASLAKIAVEEHFPDDDNNLQTFWKDMESGEIIDSSSLTWKPEGLRILKDDEDDEEIECGTFRTDTPRDLSSLVKKRKLELQEENEAREEIGRKKVAPAAQDLPITRQLAKDMGNSKDGRHEKSRSGGGAELGSLFGDAFSAENCLDNFLEVRGSKKAKLTDSSYFGTKPDKAQSAPAPQRTITPQLNTTPLALRNSPVAKAPPLPAPSLPEVPPSTSIVVSSTLLKHRSLIKYLERLLPALNIIERDFIAHNTTAWLPGSVTLSPVKSPLDSEADLIVSPSTGIVITTLQKIKQKPLPGQKSKPAIRDRLEKVSGRYEKLIVLITEGRIDETTLGLDESDCLAYSEFAGFAAGFETSITVLFVAGGEETLTKWLASTIVQHCVAGESSLLADETHWELFLRRAGLNAYAAQAILAELKAPDGVDPASPLKAGQFGLIAFIEMGRGQRIERFAPLCGRVLVERVSALIEGNWE